MGDGEKRAKPHESKHTGPDTPRRTSHLTIPSYFYKTFTVPAGTQRRTRPLKSDGVAARFALVRFVARPPPLISRPHSRRPLIAASPNRLPTNPAEVKRHDDKRSARLIRRFGRRRITRFGGLMERDFRRR